MKTWVKIHYNMWKHEFADSIDSPISRHSCCCIALVWSWLAHPKHAKQLYSLKEFDSIQKKQYICIYILDWFLIHKLWRKSTDFPTIFNQKTGHNGCKTGLRDAPTSPEPGRRCQPDNQTSWLHGLADGFGQEQGGIPCRGQLAVLAKGIWSKKCQSNI